MFFNWWLHAIVHFRLWKFSHSSRGQYPFYHCSMPNVRVFLHVRHLITHSMCWKESIFACLPLGIGMTFINWDGTTAYAPWIISLTRVFAAHKYDLVKLANCSNWKWDDPWAGESIPSLYLNYASLGGCGRNRSNHQGTYYQVQIMLQVLLKLWIFDFAQIF